jgi:hypothetical protein
MSAGDQNYSRAAQYKCLSDSTVPLSVWIVQITAARPCTRFPQHKSVCYGCRGIPWFAMERALSRIGPPTRHAVQTVAPSYRVNSVHFELRYNTHDVVVELGRPE